MSPTQLFHIPIALKRTRSAGVTTLKSRSDRRETKAEHILGVTEADINTARNQSVSSVATNKLQGNLSDATTELGTSLPRDGTKQLPELHIKASSILLHDEFCQEPSSANSIQSSRLKAYNSNSTLHSYYDASRAPLAISQQTSDSSRRDFALRKGTPVVVRPLDNKDSLTQMKLLRSSKSKADRESAKASKERPRTGASHVSFASSRPSTRRDSPPDLVSSQRGRFTPRQLAAASANSHARMQNNLLEPLDPASVKVNVRRPKVGARHWFDGHVGDSSEGESTDEPAFDETFVSGVELAFQSGRIKPPSDTATFTNTLISSSLSSQSTSKSSVFRSARQEPPPPVPRIATLNAKASKTSLRPPISQHPSSKRRLDPLARADLNKSSVLNLSSSDDEDEPLTPKHAKSALSGPAIRDSVAIAFNNESQFEFGTAETISAVPSGPDQSNVRTLQVSSQPQKRGQLHMPIPKRTSSRVLSQMTEQSAEHDLLASFPATPIESLPSHRTSIRSSLAASDAGSLESRRYMSVTKQEESLLAAMRLKKAAMRHTTTRDKRLETLRNLERGQSRLSHMTEGSNTGFVSATQLIVDTRPVPQTQSAGRRHRRSLSNEEGMRLRASGTTFQTTTSRNPSRLSALTFHTEQSEDHVTRLSLSSEGSQDASRSPSLLSLATVDRGQSRETFFSSSSPGFTGHVRRATAQSHVVALDDLDKAPEERGDVASQEFIDWPYKGWEARAQAGLAR